MNLPQYKTIFLIHLCLFNSRDISIDFFLLDQFSNRHDNRANELALSRMHNDSCAFFTLSEIGSRPPRAARASSRMLVLPQWGRGIFGKFDAQASSSLLSASQFFRFDFSECHGCIFSVILNTSLMAMPYSRFIFENEQCIISKASIFFRSGPQN